MMRVSLKRTAASLLIAGALAVFLTDGLHAQSLEEISAANRQVIQLVQQGQYAEAKSLAQQTLTLAEQVLGKEHPETLISVGALATVYSSQGHFGDAEPLLKRALEARERLLGKEHPETLVSAAGLALIYQSESRYDEAEPLFKRALEGFDRAYGKEHPATLASVAGLGLIYKAEGRYREAEPLFRRALDGFERTLGKDDPTTLANAEGLGLIYEDEGLYGEAEPLLRRALDGYERSLGKDHPNTFGSESALAGMYQAVGRYGEAELLIKRALKASERTLGNEHPNTLGSVKALATGYAAQGRFGEAEPLFRHAVDGLERVLGKEHPATLDSVAKLAAIYFIEDRFGEAEPLFKRALEGYGRKLGKDHSGTLSSLTGLAVTYQQEGRFGEAEPLFRRALEGYERTLGKEHPSTLTSAMGLAGMYQALGRYGEAEPLFRRALEGYERALGKNHPYTLISAMALARMYGAEGQYGEAEPLFRRALKGFEHTLGKENISTIVSMNGLAGLFFQQGNWARAAELWRVSTEAVASRTLLDAQELGQPLRGKQKSQVEHFGLQYEGLVKASYRLPPEASALQPVSREMFKTAQWAGSSEASRSLAQMAARGAASDPALAQLVRDRQDLLGEWQNRDGLRSQWLGNPEDKRNAKAEAENNARLAAIEQRVSDIDKELAAKFPDYATFANPTPLAIEEAQALLGQDEALVLFLHTSEWKPAPEETFIWVVTKTDMRWVRSDPGEHALTREVSALRCGLDEEEWATPTKARHCGDLLGLTELPESSRPLPFDAGRAYELYRALFGQIEDLIQSKRLLIVPSGPLTSLPFHVLVTKKPETAAPSTFEGYRNVAWLGRSTAIVTLPAVSSLKALRRREAKAQTAAQDYVGYGDPVLSGDGESCRPVKAPDACPTSGASQKPAAPAPERATIRGRGGRRIANLNQVFAKGAAPESVLEQVRALCPLPDTAYEITCVAERFKDGRRLIRLDREATKAGIRALNENGQLAKYRILHFATHGLLSGDVAMMTKRQGQPALVLTPPEKAADSDDNGLLMASDVAGLKLNADWVVLSACNTAAGESSGGEALSGLARAFFYAGARALLVSHWPVYSDAAVRLTTGAFSELERNPDLGRAEALQRSMIALMDDASQADNAHPAVWAPFVITGEGGRS